MIHIASSQTKVDPRFLTLNHYAVRTRKYSGKGLSAAHATKTSGKNPFAGPVSSVVLAAHFHKGFVGSLHDALRANVDP